MSYAIFDEQFWTDPKIKILTVETKMVFAWLFTNPHRHFSGIYSLPRVLIADQIGVSIGVSNKSLEVLEKQGFIKYSDEYSIVWVINMLKHQSGGRLSSQQIKGISKQLKTLHGCPLIKEFAEKYQYLGIPDDTPINTPIDTKKKKKYSEEVEVEELNEEGRSRDLPLSAEPTSRKGKNSLDLNALALIWNETKPPELSAVNIPFNRPPKIIARYQNSLKRNPDIEWWKKVFDRVHLSYFLRGRNDRGWKASFDFVLSKAEVILDGKYDTPGAESRQRGVMSWYEKTAKKEAIPHE